jgi:hypothetical protein
METACDHSREIIFNNALRLAVGDLAEINPKIIDQALTDCMLNDMSDINFEDMAVKAFMDMVSNEMVSTMTVGKLRNQVIEIFKENTEHLVAKEWSCNNRFKVMSELCSRGVDLTHLNQLIFYIGGKSLNESYNVARQAPPTYEQNSEHTGVRYSLGLTHCIDDGGYHEESDSYLGYSTTNIMQLMEEARYILQEEIFHLIRCSHITQSEMTIRDLIIYMNGIEILSFKYDMDVNDFYNDSLDIKARISEAKNMIGSDKFKELLLSGKLFSSDEYHPLRQRMKGKALEDALGM